MKQTVLLPVLFLFFLFSNSPFVQAQCPGCTINLPGGMADDTIFLGLIPEGQNGLAYDENVSFRMPMTTTPVSATDPSVPPNLPISEIVISSISNLPPGISWEANQSTYTPSDQPDGCIKFCGTPLVAGLYTLEVTLTATVLVVSQETSFFLDMYIAPAVSNNDGFSMNNFEGCGEVEVAFTNNIPSNGQPGYSYSWDFGNGNTSTDENPANQVYDQPGIYFVDYSANIDTAGYFLTNVTLVESDCQDILGAAPDILIKIYTSGGILIYESPKVMNTFPPISFPTNIELDDGGYVIEAIDEDSGLGGADDQCAYLNFNRLSNGTFSGPGFKLTLEILHPLATASFTDTVIVHPEPAAPNIAANKEAVCPGESALLASSYTDNNQWYLNGMPINGATDRSLSVDAAGDYQVEYTNEFGCTAISEPQTFTIFDLPDAPTIDSDLGNEICLGEEVVLTSSYADNNQWYLDNGLLDNETASTLMVGAGGMYQVAYTSEDGCTVLSTEYGLTVNDLPEIPVFENTNNLLQLAADVTLPDNYSLQWNLDGMALEGETEQSLCAIVNGVYTLIVLDLDTDCSNVYTSEIAFNPDVSCLPVGLDFIREFDLAIAPNPVQDLLQVSLDLTETASVQLQLYDLNGRPIQRFDYGQRNGAFQEGLSLGDLPGGLYVLRVWVGAEMQQIKVVKE